MWDITALARTLLAIGAFDPKTALVIVMAPGFWLLKAASATALPYPTLRWKWMSPTGKTKTSPSGGP